MSAPPCLVRHESSGVGWWSDDRLCEAERVLIAFSERGGGVSAGPWEGLNLAGHVGDDPAAVDTNRTEFMEALGIGEYRPALTMSTQVHGDSIAVVGVDQAGSGAYVSAVSAAGPIPGTDALVCAAPGIPLLMCFADCVPVALVAPGPVVALVHAGWRGALASLPGSAVDRLADTAGCPTSEIRAYVGAHIRACHYCVDERTMSHFVNAFGTVARADSGGLDLGAVVNASLVDSGVDSCNITALGICTAEETDRYFSYRAEGGRTGRHGVLACILPR